MKKRFKLREMIPIYIIVLACFLIIGAGGNRMITVLSEAAPIPDRKVIVIDAGHGGVDGGATSCTGVLESRINLEIACKLRDVMHLLGIKTVMIREDDRSVYTQGTTIAAKKISDLKERVRIVEDSQCALLVSIHQNYFQQQRYRGPQVFYAPTGGSLAAGKTLQEQLNAVFAQQSQRTVKPAGSIYLMQHIQCPGVLVECGFLSNPEEEALLRDHTYQNKLCSVLAAGCSQYLYREAVT